MLGNTKKPSVPKAEPMSEVRFATITTLIIILSYIVAITVSSLEKVLAYVGSTGSTSISFILPGLFFYKISAPDSPHKQRLLKADDDEDGRDSSIHDEDAFTSVPWRRDLLRKVSLAFAVYGLLVMVVWLVTNTFFIVVH